MQEKDTHAAQHEKVRESEELGGHTDEAQAEAAAKAAAYFEFRCVSNRRYDLTIF